MIEITKYDNDFRVLELTKRIIVRGMGMWEVDQKENQNDAAAFAEIKECVGIANVMFSCDHLIEGYKK